MHVLVTGGAGYIGSVVSEVLLARGHAVVALDDLSQGHADAVPAGAPLIVADVLDAGAVRQVLADHRIDAVVHMAAHSLVGESVVEPAKYYRTNVAGGLALLDAMRATGVGRLVLSSTAAVYGEPVRQPTEETDATAPTNPYGESKLAFERTLAWYGRAYGLAWTSLRYFNAAGASAQRGERHDPETHLIPLVLAAAAGARRTVMIFGDDYPTKDGTCVRDYVHVLDLATAHALALEQLARAGTGAIYNLGGGGAGYSVREVVAAAERVTGRRVPVEIGPRRSGDPAVLVASSTRIARDLSWRPERQDLETIVDSAWRWMRGR